MRFCDAAASAPRAEALARKCSDRPSNPGKNHEKGRRVMRQAPDDDESKQKKRSIRGLASHVIIITVASRESDSRRVVTTRLFCTRARHARAASGLAHACACCHHLHPPQQAPPSFWKGPGQQRVCTPCSVSTMRALTEEEMKAFFEKLANFIGPSIKDMLDRSDQPHVFRLHKDRV